MRPDQAETVPDVTEDESDLEDELTVLEYARLHCIALNHLDPEVPLASLREAQQNNESDGENEVVNLLGDENLPTVGTLVPNGLFNTRESPSVSRESLSFLAIIAGKILPENDVFDPDKSFDGLLDVRKKGTRFEKLELPILRTDHALDVAGWGGREEPVVEDLELPREPLDESRGDGLSWGLEGKAALENVAGIIALEKVKLEAGGLEFLLATMKDGWGEDDDRELWEREVPYKKNTACEPLTPPLLPISPPSPPLVPSSSVMELEMLSDPASLISVDAKAAEAEAFKDDTITSTEGTKVFGIESSDTIFGDDTVGEDGNIEPQEDHSPLHPGETAPASPEPQRTRASDLKVEVPLTPTDPAPVPKTVTFSNIVEEMLLDGHTDDEDGKASTQPSQNWFGEEDQKFFLEAIGPISDAVEKKVSQEQLNSADTLARVEIPLMDFSLPTPPWLQGPLNGNATQIAAYQRAMIDDVIKEHSVPPIWPGVRKIEKGLKWVPFLSELAKVAIDEQLDDDGGLADLLSVASIKEIGDSSSLTWKPEGLRILKEEDDEDEEIEPGFYYEKQSQDMSALLRKRKSELLEEREALQSRNSNHSVDNGNSEYRDVEKMVNPKEPRNKRRKSSPIERPDSPYLPPACQALLTMPHRRPGSSLAKERPLLAPANFSTDAVGHLTQPASTAPNLLLGGGIFSAGNALDNFMEIRGSRKQKLKGSSFFPQPAEIPQNKPTLPTPTSLPQPKSHPIPVPNVKLDPTPKTIIVSSDLFKNRPLFHHLKTLLPNLKEIERDFSAHNITIWQANTVAISPIASPLASEADIIVSPSTGIIITSLQAIKQKPLPGSKSKNKVLERITSVAARYARILVMVTGIDETGTELNEGDCLAMAEFMGWCAAPFLPHPATKQNSTGWNAINKKSTSENETISPTIMPVYTPGPPSILATYIATAISKYSPPQIPEPELPPHASTSHSKIPLNPQNFLEEETFWELFLRRAGMNAFAAQSVIGALKEPPGVNLYSGTGSSKKALFGIRGFVEMGADERIRRFGGEGGLGGGSMAVERVGKGVDAVWETPDN